MNATSDKQEEDTPSTGEGTFVNSCLKTGLCVRRPKANLGQTTTLGDSEREGRIGLDCLSVNPKRARMGGLLVLDCTLYILEYMRAARGYP